MSTDQSQQQAAERTRLRLREQRLQRSKLLAVLVVVACLVMATVGVRISDSDSDFRALKGKLGSTMKIDGVELTVSDVRVGQLITDGEKIENRTTGMFLLLRVRLANRDALENVGLTKSRLLSGQRIYDPYESLSNIAADPGYVATADFLFEVDPEQIDDLTLEIWSQGIVSGYHDRARIHLGITADNADQWRDAAKDGLIVNQGNQQTEVLR
jgi:hypothetical protein